MKKQIKPIFTITTVFVDKEGKPDHQRSSCVGFFGSVKKAKRCVEKDQADFDEAGYYNYIVIEQVSEGLYGGAGNTRQWWYHFNGKVWQPCRTPKAFNHVFHFMGTGIQKEHRVKFNKLNNNGKCPFCNSSLMYSSRGEYCPATGCTYIALLV